MYNLPGAIDELKAAVEAGRGCTPDYMIQLMRSAGCAIDCRGYPSVPENVEQAAAASEAVRPYIEQLHQQNAVIDAEIKAKSDSGVDMLTKMAGGATDVYAVQHPDGGLIIETVERSRESAVESFLGECDEMRYNRTEECDDLINWRKYAKLGFSVVRLEGGSGYER